MQNDLTAMQIQLFIHFRICSNFEHLLSIHVALHCMMCVCRLFAVFFFAFLLLSSFVERFVPLPFRWPQISHKRLFKYITSFRLCWFVVAVAFQRLNTKHYTIWLLCVYGWPMTSDHMLIYWFFVVFFWVKYFVFIFSRIFSICSWIRIGHRKTITTPIAA